MGIYGSPELENYIHGNKPTKPVKKEGYRPQKNVWVWVVIGIIDALILCLGMTSISDIFMIFTLDGIILFLISVLSLIINLVGKRKIGHDIISIFGYLFITLILLVIASVV